MTDLKKDAHVDDKIVYHYPLVDLENKQVKGIVTVDDQTYLSAHVDLSKGMIHIEKISGGYEGDLEEDKRMIDEIRTMAEFIIDHQIDNYCQTFLN